MTCYQLVVEGIWNRVEILYIRLIRYFLTVLRQAQHRAVGGGRGTGDRTHNANNKEINQNRLKKIIGLAKALFDGAD
jgi:hypothetical protein